jgi:puromycin-sensitive aminopeptidase
MSTKTHHFLALKATFNLKVSAPKNRIVLSNMPVIEESKDDEDPIAYRVVHFDKSPQMSTYLVAIVVGEYEAIEDKSKEGTLVRVYTPMGKTEQGKFALDTIVKAMTFYIDFFGVSYPLPKYDNIAIADFPIGAMENWGLVTFRETAILVDPENTAASNKQYVAIVVTHELAHSWFGKRMFQYSEKFD